MYCTMLKKSNNSSLIWALHLIGFVYMSVSAKVQSVIKKPADNVSYSLDPATWVGPMERFRVFHTDPLLLCCVQERSHAIIAIVWIWPDSTYPSPAKVFNQLGQCVSLELVTGDCSEETGVLLLIRQACTSGKVAHLKYKTQSNFFNQQSSKKLHWPKLKN